MAQSEDVGDLIRYVACLPPHIVINEVMINPTWNRGYVANLQRMAEGKPFTIQNTIEGRMIRHCRPLFRTRISPARLVSSYRLFGSF